MEVIEMSAWIGVECSTVQYSTVQYGTVQYGMVQSVQYGTYLAILHGKLSLPPHQWCQLCRL